MEVNILVIDDELFRGEKREKYYDEVAKSLNKTSEHFVFKLVKPDSGIRAIDFLSNSPIDFVFLDLVLDEGWLGEIPYQNLVDRIADAAPFAIVTSKFDVSNHRQLSAVVGKRNCRCLLKWSDLFQPDDISAFIFMVMSETSPRMMGLDSSVSLGADESVFILHLSDIQYGGFDKTHEGVEIQTIAQKVRAICDGKGPTFVAITGDFAELGLPSEFDGAYQWTKSLLGRLDVNELPSRRVFCVPGNHDVNLALASSGNVYYESRKYDAKGKIIKEGQVKIGSSTVNGELTKFGLASYSDFAKRVSSVTDVLTAPSPEEPEALAWLNRSFLHLGIFFYGLNTTRPLKPMIEPGREVSSVELSELSDSIENVRKLWIDEGRPDEPIVIGLCHHCPTGEIKNRSIENPDDMRRFLNGSPTHVFLHGHVHHSDVEARSMRGAVRSFVRSCASTITKPKKARPEDSNRGFNVLELRRHDCKVSEVRVHVVEWAGLSLVESNLTSSFVRLANGGFGEQTGGS